MHGADGRRANLVGALAAAAALLAGVLTVAVQPAPARADGCPDIEVIFARGTDEPPGIGDVGGAFVAALRARTGGRSVGTYAVNYPASYAFLTATDGADDASRHIGSMVDNCPDTPLVLGGYSQGAAVMDILTALPESAFGFRHPLSQREADSIAAVALFGNPSNRLGNIVPALSPQFAAKTINLCAGQDLICTGGSWDDHHRYVGSPLMEQAADFAAARL